MRRKKIRVFANGDKVFGKIRGKEAWPARIELDPQKNYNNQTYRLRFYGAEDVATLNHSNIYPFKDYSEKFLADSKNPDFLNAIKLLVEDMTSEELMKIVSCKSNESIKSPSSDQGPALTNQELSTSILSTYNRLKFVVITSDESTQSSSNSSQQLYCGEDAKNLYFNKKVPSTTVSEVKQVSKKNSNSMDENTVTQVTTNTLNQEFKEILREMNNEEENVLTQSSTLSLSKQLQDSKEKICFELISSTASEGTNQLSKEISNTIDKDINTLTHSPIIPPKKLPRTACQKTIKRKDENSNEKHPQNKKIKLQKKSSENHIFTPPSSVKLHKNEDIIKIRLEDKIPPMPATQVTNREENVSVTNIDKYPLTDSPFLRLYKLPLNVTTASQNVKTKECKRKKNKGKEEKIPKCTVDVSGVDLATSTTQELISNPDNFYLSNTPARLSKQLDDKFQLATTSNKTKCDKEQAKISKTVDGGKKKNAYQETPSNFSLDSSGNYLYSGIQPNIIIIPLNLNRPFFYLPSLNDEWNKVLLTEANNLIAKTKMANNQSFSLQTFLERIEAFTKQQAEIFKKKQVESSSFNLDMTSKFIYYGEPPDLFIIPLDLNRPNFCFNDLLNREWNEALLAYANSLVPQLVNRKGKSYTQIHQMFMENIKNISYQFLFKKSSN